MPMLAFQTTLMDRKQTISSLPFVKTLEFFKTEDMFQVLPMLAEVLRLRDSSMMSLQLTGLVTKYPDMRPEQLVNLLMCRGDLSRADARQIVSDTIGEDDPQKKRPLGIFTEIPS